MTDWLESWWPLLTVPLALVAAGHATLNKREVRSAAAWVGVILLAPGIGSLLYVLLGINRIRRFAGRVRAGMQRYQHDGAMQVTAAELVGRLASDEAHLIGIARTIERTSRWPLLAGNRATLLRGGDEAYAEMLRCIDGATRSIALCTYIFDNDRTGQRFVEALAAAHARGVQVRVLVDDAGARYSFPPIDRALRARGVPAARFLEVLRTWPAGFANLRNHRKLLVVDGAIGFAGGMNIRHSCVSEAPPKARTLDVHFRIDGPVVTALMDVFGEDWTFATRETLVGDGWFPRLGSVGTTHARVISDGPDDDLDCMRWAFLGAVGCARRSVRVVTPYFLPDEPLITALNAAALRGVDVDVVLPERGNLRLVQWAMQGELWKILPHGCRVWLTPPPFDHSKLMTVDGSWSLVGSANWDPRSLRLNFEIGVECYDRALASQLDAWTAERIAVAQRLDSSTLAARPGPVRLRDATARLLAPYL
jgi:cardiolipin synthase A/B